MFTRCENMERNIEIPEGVQLEVQDRKIIVIGPKGKVEKDFNDPRYNKAIELKKEDNALLITSKSDKRKIKAMIGTIRGHVGNMINGVTKGFRYTMKVIYSHFPITVSVQGKEIQIKNFLGEKGARTAEIMGETDVNVKKDDITLSGINVEDVGQTAANIENICRLSRKDRRIFQDGIFITGKKLLGEKK